jgi:hypothetical protein
MLQQGNFRDVTYQSTIVFLLPGIFVSALHYLLQLKVCWKYTCLLDLSGRDIHLTISHDNHTTSFQYISRYH